MRITRSYKSSVNLFMLPQEVVLDITGYLNLEDLKNFRQVCKYLYKLSGCKIVMSRIKVCPASFENGLLSFLDNNCSGRFMNLDLSHISLDNIKRILRHGSNIVGLSLKVQQIFKGLEQLSPKLEYLLIDMSEPLKHRGSRKLSYHFQAISELSNLQTIVLCGSSSNDMNTVLSHNEESKLPCKVILSILESTRQIKTIKFQHLHLVVNDKVNFQCCISTYSNVNFWSFYHVTTSWAGFKIPTNVKTLNCQFTNFVPIDASHRDLDKIIIITKQAIKLDNGAIQVLQHDPESLFWTLYAKIKHGIICVESVDHKFFRVQLFNMPYCTISGFLDTDLNGVACSISELHINEQNPLKIQPLSCAQTFNNDRLTALLSKVHNLKTLVLEDLNDITVDFLDKVSFEKMVTMKLRKCKNLSKSVVDAKLKMLESQPAYDVLVEH